MKKTYTGMSLSELLIANCIALILLAGLVKFYLVVQQMCHYHTGITRIHHNARIALHLLENEIREAGYIGCAHFSEDFPLTNSTTFEFTPANTVQGTASTLTILKGVSVSAEKIQLQGTRLSIVTPWQINSNEMLLISDCEKGDVVTATRVDHQSKSEEIHLSRFIQTPYLNNVDVLVLTSKSFFVGPTTRKNSRGQMIYALYEKDNFSSQGAVELVEGVEAMQLRYDVSQQSRLQLVNAEAVTEWQHVKGVALTLTLNSVEPAALTPTEHDPLLHRTWETYIALRERLTNES